MSFIAKAYLPGYLDLLFARRVGGRGPAAAWPTTPTGAGVMACGWPAAAPPLRRPRPSGQRSQGWGGHASARRWRVWPSWPPALRPCRSGRRRVWGRTSPAQRLQGELALLPATSSASAATATASSGTGRHNLRASTLCRWKRSACSRARSLRAEGTARCCAATASCLCVALTPGGS